MLQSQKNDSHSIPNNRTEYKLARASLKVNDRYLLLVRRRGVPQRIVTYFIVNPLNSKSHHLSRGLRLTFGFR